MEFGFNLPSGFRFHPTDDELIQDYLVRKCAGLDPAAPIIAEVDLYQHDPWDLPQMALYDGEKEWYFFSPRDRKYPNGVRPNRFAGTGYWKATGADKPIGLGIKKSLVFYAGRNPHDLKTNWIMHEYRLANVDRTTTGSSRQNKLRLDDWVLCRIYNKKGYMEKYDTTPGKKPTKVQQVCKKDQLDVPSRSAANMQEDPINSIMPPSTPIFNWFPQIRPANDEVSNVFESSNLVSMLHSDTSSSDHTDSPDSLFDKNSNMKSREGWEVGIDHLLVGFNPSVDNLLKGGGNNGDVFRTHSTHQFRINRQCTPMAMEQFSLLYQSQVSPLDEIFLQPQHNQWKPASAGGSFFKSFP